MVDKPTMTPDEFRNIRLKLGLTQRQLAKVLETAPSVISNVESLTIQRVAPTRCYQLMEAYRDGYRPAHWPKERAQNLGGNVKR